MKLFSCKLFGTVSVMFEMSSVLSKYDLLDEKRRK
jgi:hypothetical protein